MRESPPITPFGFARLYEAVAELGQQYSGEPIDPSDVSVDIDPGDVTRTDEGFTLTESAQERVIADLDAQDTVGAPRHSEIEQERQ